MSELVGALSFEYMPKSELLLKSMRFYFKISSD